MNRNALYYPYIHIEDVNWLKATLLLFYEVRRMLPFDYMPADSEEVRAFAIGGLLRGANLWTRRATAAQEALARRLLADARNKPFRRRHGPIATRQLLNEGFQIHQMKLHQPLKEALGSSGLAWAPGTQKYDPSSEYVEVNPRVGEAIMSTLAIAAASGEGLDIVGDHRSGRLHDCLLQKKADEFYDAWLRPTSRWVAAKETQPQDLFEFLVGFSCDLRNVTSTSLAELQQDREPLRALIERLQSMATQIPAMDPSHERDTYFRDVASDILEKWRQDRSNLASYWRKFFGEGLAETGQKFVEKTAEKLTSGTEKTAAAGGLGAAAATALAGGSMAAMATAAVVGTSVGLSIAVVFHGVRSYFRMRKAEKDSPYRYLTLMEQAGVIFRSDLGTAPPATPYGHTVAVTPV